MLGSQILGSAIDEIAEELDGRPAVNERDHLQPAVAGVLAEKLRRGWRRPRLATQHQLGLDWPSLGAVDIALTDRDGTLLVELKAGAKQDSLGPCVWDLVKLATALRHGRAKRAYLLATTTKLMWERPVRGAEFLTGGTFTAQQLAVAYARAGSRGCCGWPTSKPPGTTGSCGRPPPRSSSYTGTRAEA